jgi:hypothetical protein
MSLARYSKTALACVLAVQLVAVGTMAQAQMIGTDTAIQRQTADMDRAYLMDELKKDEVRDEIVRLGVSPDEAEARLAALSDAEVARMINQYEQDKAGGDGIIGALVTVFIILLVTDLLCFTRLFNFTRCIR